MPPKISKMRLRPLLLFISVLVKGIEGEDCRTQNGHGPPCLFPYRLNGELYFECTTKFLPNSTDALCPVLLENPITREASSRREDWGLCHSTCNLMHFRTNEEIFEDLKILSNQFPNLALGFALGSSVENNPIMGLRISRGVREEREVLKPMVRLVGNMHGNEAIGREVVLHLAHHLLHAYTQDERIRELVDNTDISLLPTLNPDGFERADKGDCSGTGKKHGMYNSGNVDLNKDFPDFKDWKRFQEDYSFTVYPGRQPETIAMMDWSVSNPFVLSANLHDGAVMVTFPYDFQAGENIREANLTPDNDIFSHLAENYVTTHPTMGNLTKCFRRVPGGWINGAEWHSTNSAGSSNGSLKDFSYLFTNNFELTLELTCCKFPTRYFILREWENNKESLLSFLEQVHMGVKGVVFGPDGIPAENADVVVWNPDGSRRGKNMTTFTTGEYWRLLLPGKRVNNGESTYIIQAFYEDCDNTGRTYASIRHKVLVSEKSPIVLQHMFLRHVGFCGIQVFDGTRSREQLLNEIEELVQQTPKEEEDDILDLVFENLAEREELGNEDYSQNQEEFYSQGPEEDDNFQDTDQEQDQDQDHNQDNSKNENIERIEESPRSRQEPDDKLLDTTISLS